MIPILVINLKRRSDRKDKITLELEKYGLTDYAFLEAVDGTDPGVFSKIRNLYNEKRANRINRKLAPGEVATALSHQKAYKQIIKNSLSGAIILEDDAILSKEFAKFANREYDLDLNVDLINLGYYTSNQNLKRDEAIPDYDVKNVSVKNVRYLEDDISISKVYFQEDVVDSEHKLYTPKYPSLDLDFIHGMHSYYVSLNGAKKLIKLNTPIMVESDNVWNYFHEHLNGKLLYPPITSTTRVESDVNESRKSIQQDIPRNSRENVYYLRRLKHHDYGRKDIV